MYDVERFGIINAGNPKHADVFLVTGSVNEQNIEIIKEIYDQMPRPKIVVAVGICAISGGVFKECYNIKGGVDTVIPVDVYVPGCAARPEAIIDGVVLGLGLLAEKKARMAEELKAEKTALENAPTDIPKDAPESATEIIERPAEAYAPKYMPKDKPEVAPETVARSEEAYTPKDKPEAAPETIERPAEALKTEVTADAVKEKPAPTKEEIKGVK
jgi:ech hydrogenase subunit C